MDSTSRHTTGDAGQGGHDAAAHDALLRPVGASARIDVVNPATGVRVGHVAGASIASVADTVAAARAAQVAWRAAGWQARARVLRRFHDLVLARVSRICDTVQGESGKARRDALAELVTVAGTARHYLAHGRSYLADERRQGAVPLVTGARTVRKPHGVVGLITPWNFPFLLVAGDALPALLAGNAVVVKPSELTPLSAELVHELLVEAGLDPALFALVHGAGPEVGAALIDAVDYIGFTGSTATGRIVARRAADRLIPCSLELGGKNPMVVLEGADVGRAVTGLCSGAFTNTGQTCIAIERAYVHASIHDAFVTQAARRAKDLKVGWSTGWDSDMGSLVSEAQADRVEAHIEDARAKGATIVAGGNRRRDLGPAFIEPTVIVGVRPDMLLAREETFGPVVSITSFQTVDEAVELANDTDYGLNAAVWAGSRRAGVEVARRLETGTAGVNSTLQVYNSFAVPMGGVRQSGLGRRHGAEGIRRYTQVQSIVTGPSRAGGYDSLIGAMTSPRRVTALTSIVRAWRHAPPFLR